MGDVGTASSALVSDDVAVNRVVNDGQKNEMWNVKVYEHVSGKESVLVPRSCDRVNENRGYLFCVRNVRVNNIMIRDDTDCILYMLFRYIRVRYALLSNRGNISCLLVPLPCE